MKENQRKLIELTKNCEGCWIKPYKGLCAILCSHKITPREILGE